MLLILVCAFIYVRERRLVRDSNLERRLRHVVLGEKPTIHRLEAVDVSQRSRPQRLEESRYSNCQNQ